MNETPVPWWTLRLARPPQLVQAGFGQHGRRTVERYRLPSLWVIHLYDYHAELRLDGRPLTIEPGTVGLTPPGVEMAYRYFNPVEHHYAHFAVDAAAGASRGGEVSVPAIQRYPHDLFERWQAAMWEVIGWRAERPARAAARFWELLWRVVDHAGGERPSGPVERAELVEAKRIMERRMGGPIRIADLAAEVGLSHNHLTRLFREAEGMTPIQYLNRRRAERAAHLLRETTLPIKAIALELGMDDLPRFNKFIRTRFGRSPRDIRQAATSD